ncbi:hypothetical protein [Sandaracinus amylolyticus]|uniref:hypothetical protein n=1 Tax=Sandaracinus amylolyticus TaxID=927083 RepID=UPI001F2959A4|nr:hypothetical protein [Sandaracinus amylolyticus]UJR79702.1 Hypothetical protein I5071_17400 [Sandaracinus amylolyticus]
MGASDRTFVLGGVIALPVGRRVEVTIFAREEGVFSVAKVPQSDEPLVRDLDTGVVYGRSWHFQDEQATRWNALISMSVRDDLEVAERVVGRVIACRVLSEGYSDPWQQTTIVVAPEASTSEYR